ncbi:AAA family ATPase [Nocardia nova]|uniref:AAA family ATPase n=1 Tax=Nocardia nova TaxID=37330 RepID=UPI001C449C4E|nr:AAA family ATPase [Nocardia nova]MBV7706807.1 AAA family ATPase [Nocardia nova]
MTNPGGNARGAVPAPTHGFVGRKDELALISTLLISGPDRLITLIGPGGIGKTRLADEAARRAKAQGVRVYWVPLARLPVDAEFKQVEQATASAVISADFSNRGAREALEAALRGTDSANPSRRAVLVLDNGEHVLPALRHLIAQLLSNLPNLTILATSRSPIAWVDERLIPVPVLSPAESLALFRQRCTLIGRSLEWNADDIAAATEICEHITHHPLHIRLAVGRLRYQGLADLCAELTGRADDKRLGWSTGARSGADARHLAITNVIAWSYQLLRIDWSADDLRFGFHVLIASTAVRKNWTAVRLEVRRRNPLRSFGPRPAGEFRMGAKFTETSASVRRHIGRIAREAAPWAWTPSPAETPVDAGFVVPLHDPDIERLALTTAQQLREDAHHERLSCFASPLGEQLAEFALGGDAERGLSWALWRECLFAWLGTDDDKQIPVEVFETLFLNRAVGHHTEIAGRPDWYSTVVAQARDVFARRNRLAAGT